MRIIIISVGKTKDDFFKMAVTEYAKRLPAFCKIDLIEIPDETLPDNPSDAQIKTALEKESQRIQEKIPQKGKIIAMCVEGVKFSSEKFAYEIIANDYINYITFVIGSSFGLSEKLKNMAHIRFSMSEMTFPHALARIMLIEQIYRAFTILNNFKYHK